MKNLFTPTFGKIPLCLAGRDDILNDILDALDDEPGNPNLSTILVGARGTGKTALLAYIAEKASAHGWICANVTCGNGMLEDILIQLGRSAKEFLHSEGGKKLKGVSIGQLFSIEWENREEAEPQNWRSRLTDIIEKCNADNVGVLLTVDEVQPNYEEMIQLAAVYQHLIRENRKAALLMAGLPQQVSLLLKDKSVSFLRRAQYRKLGRIPDGAAETAFEETITQSGRTIDAKALRTAVKEADGFPYMIQLVGYRTLQQNPQAIPVSAEDVRTGARWARRDLTDHVFRTTYEELSAGDKKYLSAMLPDKNASSTAEIARRMECSAGYASKYRQRLMEQGIIRSAGRGSVKFDMPGFREFLEEEQG